MKKILENCEPTGRFEATPEQMAVRFERSRPMNKDKEKESASSSSRPINLDSEQFEALEKLIDSLKKEVVFPPRKKGQKPMASQPG